MSSNRKITITELARSLQVHRHTLRKQLLNHGIARPVHSTISDQDLDELIAAYKELHPKSGIRYVLGFLSQVGLHIQRARVARSGVPLTLGLEELVTTFHQCKFTAKS